MLKIVSSTTQLAGVTTTIEEVEDVVTTLVVDGRNITHPSVMVWRCPILNISLLGWLADLLFIKGRSKELHLAHYITLSPLPATRKRRIADCKIIIVELAINIERELHTRKVQHNLVPRKWLCKQRERNTHSQMVYLTFREWRLQRQRRLQHPQRAIRERIGLIVLCAIIVWTNSLDINTQHIGNFK